jgi:hypothetical protein
MGVDQTFSLADRDSPDPVLRVLDAGFIAI